MTDFNTSTDSVTLVDERTVDERAVGQKTVDQQTVDQQTVGQQTVGQQTVGQQTVGQQVVDREVIDREVINEVASKVTAKEVYSANQTPFKNNHFNKANKENLALPNESSNQTLRDNVETALKNYFSHLDGHPATGVYDMVLTEVEAPLLEAVMEYTKHNQTKASEVLGLNRGTLRKKLKRYGIV